MGRIAEEIIQRIRDRIDIVDLVGRSVSLKQAGRNFKGLCPFHDEKTPSFNVRPDRGSFYCFGCNEGGDVFAFLIKSENLTFPEAVRTLGREAGIEVPESAGAERGVTERLFEVTELAQRCFRDALGVAGNPGADYLAKRGLDPETIDDFGIGFAPDRWDTVANALRAARIPADVGEQAGLLAPRERGGHYDRLRGRVVFPIRDVRGRIVAFGGRALGADQTPKYLNTPESPIFHKRSSFYGLPGALEPIRRSERAVVVEGYFDLIALHRAGIENVLATCGTALGEDHARGLRRRTREVLLLFDGDEAGQRAMERALEILLPQGLRVRAAALPAGQDPDDFREQEGDAALRALVAAAPPALERVIQRSVAQGRATAWEKADAVELVARVLALVPSAVERSEFARQLALAVDTDPANVEAAVRAVVRGADAREAVPMPPRRQGPEDRIVMELARSFVEYPLLVRDVAREELAPLLPDGPLGELVTALLDALPEAPKPDVEALAARLGGEARSLLRLLVADERELDEETAARVVEDTLRWLRRRRHREARRELTSKLRGGDQDWREVLVEKDRLRDEFEDVETVPPMGTPN